MDCSLCCEPFEEDGHRAPRTLHCGHTFCTYCIEMLERTQPRFSARCPECRAFIRFHRIPPINFPKNFKLLEVIRDRKGPPPKTGADTTAAYNDHRGNDATDPSGFLERGPEAHQPVSPRNPPSEEPPPWIHFGWTPRVAVDSNERARGLIRGSWRQGQLDPVVEVVPPPRPSSRLFGYSGGARAPPRPPVPVPPIPEAPAAASPPLEEGSSSQEAEIWHTNGSAGLAGLPLNGDRNPVMRGRAVEGADGVLVCRFFQEGTCRYGPFCWFDHPCINPSKPMCKHWLQGRCRMGLCCNYRHGAVGSTQRGRRRRSGQRGQRSRDPDPSGDAEPSRQGPSRPIGGGSPGGSPAVAERSVVLVGGQGGAVTYMQQGANSNLGRHGPEGAYSQGERSVRSEGGGRASDEGFYDTFGSTSGLLRRGSGQGNA